MILPVVRLFDFIVRLVAYSSSENPSGSSANVRSSFMRFAEYKLDRCGSSDRLFFSVNSLFLLIVFTSLLFFSVS